MVDKGTNTAEEKNAPQGGALVVVPKNNEDLVEEEIDSQILSIIGLEDVFDLTYEEYATLLKEAAVRGRMPSSQMSTGAVELVTNELKRVRGKTGRFKVKRGKVNIDKVMNRRAPSPQRILPQSLAPPEEENETEKVKKFLMGNLPDRLSLIADSLDDINKTLQQQLGIEKKVSETERKEVSKSKKAEREREIEKKDKKKSDEGIKKLKGPVTGFFDAIKRYFGNILAGSIVVGLVNWFQNPANKGAIDKFGNFITDNAPLILGGILALALLPVASTLLGLTGSILGGIGMLTKAIGGLGGLLLKIPGVAPFLGMAVGAPLAGLAATGLFAKYGVPAITDAAAKLDLGVAAGEDPLVRQAYSQLKEEGKAYKVTTGRGGKKVRVEKSTAEMSAEEKKIFDAARAKESKARELAVDFSRSNQDLYDLNKKLKDLQKEKPRNLPGGGRTRTKTDINADIQSIKDQIKAKEKEKASKKKVLYDYLKIDPNKPQVQPQTSAIPGALSSSEKSEKTEPGSTSEGVNVVAMTHPDTGDGYGIPGVVDGKGRPAVFSKPAAEAFAKMIKDSGGKVKGSDIASSKRSPAKNAAIGGAAGSRHMTGTAMDIHGVSNAWIRQHGAKYGWVAHDYAGSHGGHFIFKGPGIQTSPTTTIPSAQIAQTSPQIPSIPSPTGRSGIGGVVPFPIGGQQQVTSGSSASQPTIPGFSAEDPNNTNIMTIKAIYNLVG